MMSFHVCVEGIERGSLATIRALPLSAVLDHSAPDQHVAGFIPLPHHDSTRTAWTQQGSARPGGIQFVKIKRDRFTVYSLYGMWTCEHCKNFSTYNTFHKDCRNNWQLPRACSQYGSTGWLILPCIHNPHTAICPPLWSVSPSWILSDTRFLKIHNISTTAYAYCSCVY